MRVSVGFNSGSLYMGQEHYEGAEEVYLDSAQDGMGLASNTDNN